eukprot:5941928-Amphidinium_carterae.1
MDERRLLPEDKTVAGDYPRGFEREEARRSLFRAPAGTQQLKAVLSLDMLQTSADNADWSPHLDMLIDLIVPDLELRGLGNDRISTFCGRLRACALLLENVYHGHLDPELWSAKRLVESPSRIWSAEQQQVLDAVKAGTSVEDATDLMHADRLLHVTGGPGT